MRAAIKTTQSVFNNVTMARRGGVEHFLGQKGPPMLHTLTGFNYEKFNLLEWMHNLARAFNCFLNLMVGSDAAFDQRARETSRELGLFPDIWQPVYLSHCRRQVLSSLTNETIQRGGAVWLRRWLKICAVTVERGDGIAVVRRKVTEVRDMARRGPVLLRGVKASGIRDC